MGTKSDVEIATENQLQVTRRKTWSKVVEEDMRKLNITEDMVEDRKQWETRDGK